VNAQEKMLYSQLAAGHIHFNLQAIFGKHKLYYIQQINLLKSN